MEFNWEGSQTFEDYQRSDQDLSFTTRPVALPPFVSESLKSSRVHLILQVLRRMHRPRPFHQRLYVSALLRRRGGLVIGRGVAFMTQLYRYARCRCIMTRHTTLETVCLQAQISTRCFYLRMSASCLCFYFPFISFALLTFYESH